MLQYIDQYINYIKHHKRYSEHTSIAYAKDLVLLEGFIKEHLGASENGSVGLNALTTKNIRLWISDLSENGNTATTVNRKLSVVKSFCQFLYKQEYIEKNPAKHIPTLKTAKPLPQFVSEKNINELFDYRYFDEDFEGLKHKTIIALFYFTGIRKNELIQLKIQDIDWSKKQIKVLGKRNKERIIPLHLEMIVLLEKYMEERAKVLNGVFFEYLFFSKTIKKMYPKLVYNIVNQYLGKVSSLQKKSPHILRHTFATHMLNNGADLNSVKELLGHSSLAATQIYTHNSFEKLKQVYETSHPRD